MFKWRKHKKIVAADQAQKLPDPGDRVILHEHDLSKWDYLGYTEIHFTDENKVVTGRYPIFLFVDKNNDKRRSYYLSASSSDMVKYVESRHSYVAKSLKPWAAGEGNIYQLISHENSLPSDYLKAYMLEHYNCEWDTSTHWWGSTDNAKYTAAQNKQKREKKTNTEGKSTTNVVTVDFGKQA